MRPMPIALIVALLAAIASAGENTREQFLKLIDRPRVALDAQISADGTTFSYMSEAGQRVPGVLVKPATQPSAASHRPVVIALHGTAHAMRSSAAAAR